MENKNKKWKIKGKKRDCRQDNFITLKMGLAWEFNLHPSTPVFNLMENIKLDIIVH